ncbi:leucine-rich repeat-containing protein 25-like [Scyliorhinus canicula]|uniref:leucine-rich repeat-containing protein 25-like n=1 Tax=Scyliorhinus canicula TaxID=7830 RepID=UPI0018F79586|nr:leucine-rich repeat-containing protein 25-like [Scyliorhinus canicula]
MKILGVVIILLHAESTVGSQCEGPPINPEWGNCSISCLDWGALQLKDQIVLSLPNCKISRIVNLVPNSALETLILSNNNLQQLPEDLLQNLTGLKVLNVTGNPLTSIPLSVVLQIQVSFDCFCGLLRGLQQSCSETANCSLDNLSCSSTSGPQLFNASSFYDAECPETDHLLALYILLPLLAAAIAGAAVFLLVRRCSQRSAGTLSTNKSLSASDAGQQRYVSATNWKGSAAEAESGTSQCPRASGQQQQQPVHQDYENMLVGESHGKPGRHDRNQKTTDDTYYLESDPASDIYLNEQPIYCNYEGSMPNPEDDVYIIPDK